MNTEIKQELMNHLKNNYGLTEDQTVFDLDEESQLEFQKEFEKAVNPTRRVFQAIIKTITSQGEKYTRHAVEI